MMNYRRCAFCGETISGLTAVCPYCAEPQPQVQVTTQPSQPQYLPPQPQQAFASNGAANVRCDACGSHMQVNPGSSQVTCVYCGAIKILPQQPEYIAVGGHSQSVNVNVVMPVTTEISTAAVNKVVYLLLCWFLGWFGAHKFYIGKTTAGILYLVFCWTFIPAILSLIDFIDGLMKPSDAYGNIHF